MPKFRVWTYDVWGNAKDGYEVNDRRELTDYFHDDKLLQVPDDSDDTVIRALKDRGWLKKTAQKRWLDIQGDGSSISIDVRRDGYPLLGLELIEEEK